MRNLSKLKNKLNAMVERHPGLGNRATVSSIWDWECYGKNGRLKWRETRTNKVTNEGLNALLNIMFHGATPIATWYIGLFEDDHSPAAGDTYATPGFTECTAYDEATRVAFNEAAASGQSITNSANKASFTMNASKTIYGGFLCGGGTDPNTKGDTEGGGTLYCASAFASSKAVEDDDVLKVTVTLSAADVL